MYNPSHLSRFVQDGESDEDEDDAHDGGGHDPADAGARCRCQFLREFIVGALQPHTFFSLPQKPVGDAPAKLAFYQLLDAGSEGILVDAVGSDANKTGLLMCSVQPLEVWSPAFRDGVIVNAIPNQIDAFAFEDPKRIDMLAMTGTSPLVVDHLHRWTPEVSDVEGCITLTKPEKARPQSDPMSHRAPVLVVMLELKSQGWVGVHKFCRHAREGPKEYDARAVQSKLAYLQVLLSWAQLVAAGVVDVPRDQPQSLYKCLLHFKKPIAEGARVTSITACC